MTTLPRTNDVRTGPGRRRTTGTGRRRTTYAVLVRLAILAVVLEGVWAGLFLQHDGQRDAAGTWLNTHAIGAVAAVALAALATVFALWGLRARRDLWAGGLLLTVALAAETALGFQISDAGQDAATVVHIPLALGVLALAVWLSLRAGRE